MKKWFVLVLTLALMLCSITGCSSNTDTGTSSGNSEAANSQSMEDAPAEASLAGKNVTMIVPFSAGGGTDVGNRILVPYLEECLDATITVVNQPGAAGWTALAEFKKSAAPDGETIFAFNDTINYAGLNPESPHEEKAEDFYWVGFSVVDLASLACSANETRWTDAASMIEYAKENPLTFTVSGSGTEDQIAVERINAALGTQFEVVVTAGGAAEANAALLGGHVDLVSANVGEILTYCNDGQMKCMMTFGQERSRFFPDVPTAEEVTGVPIYAHSARGHLLPLDTDDAMKELWVEAYEKAATDPEFISQMDELGLEVDYRGPEEAMETIKNSEASVREILPELGWA